MPSRRALLLIDFQRDFLADDGRLPVARHQVGAVIAAANAAVAKARAEGAAIIAIGNEFRPSDWIANIFRRHAAIAGSDGARWDDRIDRSGATYFPKWAGNAFSNPALGRFIADQGIDTVTLTGLYANACVTATAKGALARGLTVEIEPDAVAAGSDRARAKAVERLERRGVKILVASETIAPHPAPLPQAGEGGTRLAGG